MCSSCREPVSASHRWLLVPRAGWPQGDIHTLSPKCPGYLWGSRQPLGLLEQPDLEKSVCALLHSFILSLGKYGLSISCALGLTLSLGDEPDRPRLRPHGADILMEGLDERNASKHLGSFRYG